ncbi:MAG TPA: TonB-dependent receptor plug domain-containing protein [Chryseosolibacter sp.]
MNLKKLLLATALVIVIASSGFVLYTNNETLTRIAEKFMAYQAKRPIEKVYLHLDKPYYASGEDIWFKAYLVDGLKLSLDSSISRVMYVELLNADRKLIERHTLPIPEGVSNGDFHLSDTIPQGNYLIRAYTNYMKNFGEDFFFTKEISVYDPAAKITQAPAAVQAKPDVQFFPEGGNLVTGIESRVAFKAINALGESTAIEGEIVDDTKTVAAFTTDHKGMGSFKFTPETGKRYTAKLKGSLAGLTFSLPEVLKTGYSMQVVDAGSTVKIAVSSNVSNPAPFHIVGQARGEIYFAATGDVKGAPVVASLTKSKFPTGIAQITVFDGEGQPQCERLIFINHGDQAKLTVTADKASYSKRELVTLSLQAQDSKGKPVAGNFSVTIFDENTVEPASPYESTIADYFLMTSDLAGKIEDPAYYLKDKAAETAKHLDLLMLTHGWRRFTWKEILKDQQTPIAHYAEQGIRLSGKLVKSVGQKPAANAKLKVFTAKGELIMMTADENGNFYTEDLAHFDSTRLAIQTENEKGKQTSMKMTIDPYNVSPPSNYVLAPFKPYGLDEFLKQAEYRAKVQHAFNLEQDARWLEGVEISATRIDPIRKPAVYGKPSATVTSKDISAGAVNILQAIQARVPGVIIRGTPPNMTINLRAGNDGPPLFTLDGTPVDAEVVNSLNPADVEYVDIVRGTGAAIYGSRGINGVVAIYSKSGSNSTRPTVGMERVSYPGYYTAREFYVPKYNQPSDLPNHPDIRTTLYWNPFIETDEQGNAKVTFYASDVTSKFKIVVQGISYGGAPGTGVNSITVQ